MSAEQGGQNDRIRQLATEFYKKEKAAVLKNSAAKKMKDVFSSNPDVFRQSNGWMDSFAMDRFGDELYAATIVDAIEQKMKKDPSYVIDTNNMFAQMDKQGKDVRQIFVERLCESSLPAAAEAGNRIVEDIKKGEIEKAEEEAKEKRIVHMENQLEILSRAEDLARADNYDSGHAIQTAEFAKETKDKFFDRELYLWTELYHLYNKSADDVFCEKVADRLLSKFAKSYYKTEGADVKSFMEVPEEERRSWISRFHENSLYIFGQLAKNGTEQDRVVLSTQRFAPALSAEMYRRYPEYEAETLAEMPVQIRFIRGADSELMEGASGYKYKMQTGKTFIVPFDIVKAADDFNGFIIRGTKGWARSYVLYSSDGSGNVSLADVEADVAVANDKFYKQIVNLFSK